jgi:diacylglycerol kinase
MTKTTFRDSVICASRGLFKGISSERNIKIQLILIFFIILATILLDVSKTYLITIIVICFLVVILEMFNRGFEKLIDLISPEYNKEFGRVKDIMAGVVLLTFIMVVVISIIILYHPFIVFLEIVSKNPILLALMASSIFLSLIILMAYYIKKNKN